MNPIFQNAMRKVTGLIRGGDLHAATAAIQAALRAAALAGGAPPEGAVRSPTPIDEARHEVIDIEAREVPDTPATDGATDWTTGVPADARVAPQPAPGRDAASGNDCFIAGSHANASDRRDYKLYIPPGAGRRALPLVVMLHGCTQDPDDFAAGTAMNEAARAQGFFVLYPAQSQSANPQRCWNWFKHSHQARGRGEPALLAGMTRDVIARHAIDPQQVFVAGLSAGGAMAAILGEAYPDLYAAVGVHSGLAAGIARDLPSALAAMQGGGAGNAHAAASGVPTIVFHGDADATVHPHNGEQVVAASAGASTRVEREHVPGLRGRSATRQVHRLPDGQVVAEHWLVHGAPHAWSGGSASGSYTDGRGPDASTEMLRFFFEHPRRPTH